MTLSFTINETLKWLSSLPILMQESLWRWQCNDRCIICLSPHLHTPPPPLLPVPNKLYGFYGRTMFTYLHRSRTSQSARSEPRVAVTENTMKRFANVGQRNASLLSAVPGSFRFLFQAVKNPSLLSFFFPCFLCLSSFLSFFLSFLVFFSLKIQTHKRFKLMLFIRTKRNMRSFGIIPFIKLQNDT